MAVAEEDIGPAGVERGDLVVVAGIVALGDDSGVVLRPVTELVIGAVPVVRGARDAVALVGLGPAPEAAIRRVAARRARGRTD